MLGETNIRPSVCWEKTNMHGFTLENRGESWRISIHGRVGVFYMDLQLTKNTRAITARERRRSPEIDGDPWRSGKKAGDCRISLVISRSKNTLDFCPPFCLIVVALASLRYWREGDNAT